MSRKFKLVFYLFFIFGRGGEIHCNFREKRIFDQLEIGTGTNIVDFIFSQFRL